MRKCRTGRMTAMSDALPTPKLYRVSCTVHYDVSAESPEQAMQMVKDGEEVFDSTIEDWRVRLVEPEGNAP